jgi:hypothetical protein
MVVWPAEQLWNSHVVYLRRICEKGLCSKVTCREITTFMHLVTVTSWPFYIIRKRSIPSSTKWFRSVSFSQFCKLFTLCGAMCIPQDSVPWALLYAVMKQYDGEWSNALHWYQRKIILLFRLWYLELSHRELLSLDTKVSQESTISVFGVKVTLKIEADLSFKTLLSIDTTTRCQNPEQHDWDTRHPEDVIS